MRKISVIIPTYDNVEALDLCLKSCIEGQVNENEIIVVIDNKYDIFDFVMDKYTEYISILPLQENRGLPLATNYGVYNSSNELVLIVNDDNVFPENWDVDLLTDYYPKTVLTPNQIEPRPSMFKQFHIENCGETPSTFCFEKFKDISKDIKEKKWDECGSTLPIFISKTDYLSVGGWDENFPKNGIACDWDFFLKCKSIGMSMRRTYRSHFYHFGSMTVSGKERNEQEISAHEWAKYKWNSYIKHNPINNDKFI